MVNVIIVTYNQKDYVVEAMNSVLSQDYEKIKIIVSDDCSTDGTVDLIKEYSKKYPKKIIPLFSDRNLGLTQNIDRATKHCEGKYISHLGGDDMMLKDKISNQMLYATEENIVYCNHKLIDHHGNFIKTINVDKFKFIRQDRWILFDDRLNGCNLLIPKKILIKEGLFNEKLKHIQDYDMWYKLSKKYKFLNTKNYFVKSRIHANQDSHKKSKEAFNEKKKFYTKQISLITKKNFFIALMIYASNKIRGNI